MSGLFFEWFLRPAAGSREWRPVKTGGHRLAEKGQSLNGRLVVRPTTCLTTGGRQ
jgi:hypothetical protein